MDKGLKDALAELGAEFGASKAGASDLYEALTALGVDPTATPRLRRKLGRGFEACSLLAALAASARASGDEAQAKILDRVEAALRRALAEEIVFTEAGPELEL